MRLAELANSMLWSAPMAALLVLPAAIMLGINLESSPQQVAYLYGLSLLGTWATLIPNKIFEGRALDMSTRRLIALVAGLVVGGIAIFLGRSLQLGLPLQRQFFGHPQDLEPLYFAAMYGASAGWFGLAVRDRRKRFRLIPIALTAFLGAALLPLWPYERPDGLIAAVLIATTTQIVSPWSEQAARYAQYVRYAKKQNRQVKTA
jgi:hypothetical protein